jgi:hypothetical protein
MRRFADPICVLTGPDDQPRVFRWRGRRYEVTEVLAQWLEVTPWWRGSAPQADGLHDRQRRVWRVEAGGGVFDLAAAGSPPASHTRWLLLAALD